MILGPYFFMLFSYIFIYASLFFSCTVPCRIVLATPVDLVKCKYNRRSALDPTAFVTLFRTIICDLVFV